MSAKRDLLKAAIAHGAQLDADDLTDARLEEAVDQFLDQQRGEWQPLQLWPTRESGERQWRCPNHTKRIGNSAWSDIGLRDALRRHLERYHPERDLDTELANAEHPS